MSGKGKKPLVPRLRFAEFRDAGEWEEKRLEQVAIFLNPYKKTSRLNIHQL